MADIIHFSYPFHSIFRLELFRDTLCPFHLPYKRFQTRLSLFVNVGKVLGSEFGKLLRGLADFYLQALH